MHADKTLKNESNDSSGNLSKRQSTSTSAFQFAENKPEAIVQMELQEIVNNSPQVKQLRILRKMVNNSPHVKQLKAVQAIADRYILQTAQQIGKPVQRIVNWNSLKYGPEKQLNLLRRKLGKTGLDPGRIAEIMQQASDPNHTYRYVGVIPVRKYSASEQVSASEEEMVVQPPGPKEEVIEAPVPAAEPIVNPPEQNEAVSIHSPVPKAEEMEVQVPALVPAAAAAPLPAHEASAWEYAPSRLAEMSEEDYETYAASSAKWMKKRAEKDLAKLKAGKYLYHGTSMDVAKKVAGTGLLPANPAFRKISSMGKRWDASRDGFLSMAQELKGVTVKAQSVILRMKIKAEDLAFWQWKPVGGADEVVSTLPIPPERLEWSMNKKDWYPMSEIVRLG